MARSSGSTSFRPLKVAVAVFMVGIGSILVLAGISSFFLEYGLFIGLVIGVPVFLLGAVGVVYGIFLLRAATRSPRRESEDTTVGQ